MTGSRGQVAAKRAEAERRRQADQDAEDRLNAKLEREQAPPIAVENGVVQRFKRSFSV